VELFFRLFAVERPLCFDLFLAAVAERRLFPRCVLCTHGLQSPRAAAALMRPVQAPTSLVGALRAVVCVRASHSTPVEAAARYLRDPCCAACNIAAPCTGAAQDLSVRAATAASSLRFFPVTHRVSRCRSLFRCRDGMACVAQCVARPTVVLQRSLPWNSQRRQLDLAQLRGLSSCLAADLGVGGGARGLMEAGSQEAEGAGRKASSREAQATERAGQDRPRPHQGQARAGGPPRSSSAGAREASPQACRRSHPYSVRCGCCCAGQAGAACSQGHQTRRGGGGIPA